MAEPSNDSHDLGAEPSNEERMNKGEEEGYKEHRDWVYCFFDTETSGLAKNIRASYQSKKNFPHILQLAWKLSTEDPQCHYMKTKRESHPKALATHKITPEKLELEGKDPVEVMKLFCEDVKKADALVAHNIEFDYSIVVHFLWSHQMCDELIMMQGKLQFCTKLASTYIVQIPSVDGFLCKWPTLKELAQYYKVGCHEDSLHDAMYDVATLQRCFEALIADPQFKSLVTEKGPLVLKPRPTLSAPSPTPPPSQITIAAQKRKQQQQDETKGEPTTKLPCLSLLTEIDPQPIAQQV